MMEFNDELVETVDPSELDIGFISTYEKLQDGTKRMIGHSAIFVVEGVIKFNNEYPIPKELFQNTRIWLGKKGLGWCFNELFLTFLQAPMTVRYCYEMKQQELYAERQYLEGNY